MRHGNVNHSFGVPKERQNETKKDTETYSTL